MKSSITACAGDVVSLQRGLGGGVLIKGNAPSQAGHASVRKIEEKGVFTGLQRGGMGAAVTAWPGLIVVWTQSVDVAANAIRHELSNSGYACL
jgi:hypothetical protein